jgi:hypothetical protein
MVRGGCICNDQQASLTVNRSTYPVQKQWSNAHNACIVTNVASPVPALSAPVLAALGLLLALRAALGIASQNARNPRGGTVV